MFTVLNLKIENIHAKLSLSDFILAQRQPATSLFVSDHKKYQIYLLSCLKDHHYL